jgi:hypothetical protein
MRPTTRGLGFFHARRTAVSVAFSKQDGILARFADYEMTALMLT